MKHGIAWVLFAAGIVACSGSEDAGEDRGSVILTPDHGGVTDPGTAHDPGPRSDEGGPADPGQPPQDPGSTPTDEGQPPVDPGTPQDDEGQPPTDPGTPPTDPGAPPDPGTPPADPGPKDPGPTDPGSPPADPGPLLCGPGACTHDPVGSCKAYFDCVGPCTDAACQSACQSRMSATGLAEYQALTACVNQYCAGITDDALFSECIDEYCLHPYFGCFYGCDSCSCVQLRGCIGDCPDDNAATTTVDERQECVNGCWNNAVPDAQLDLQYAINCARSACPICATATTPAQQAECDTCFGDAADTTCATLWDQCTTYGAATCGATITCTNACPDGDDPCVQACIDATSKAARAKLDALYDCLGAACPEGAAATCYSDVQAVGGACRSVLDTCWADA